MEILLKEQKTIESLYKHICEKEGLKPLKIYFGNVGKGGALCAYYANRNGTKTARYIKIDLHRICVGAAYALCHEVAHQIEITENNNATHNYKFKSCEKKLLKKYVNCAIAKKLLF